jgi:hypothetical protein
MSRKRKHGTATVPITFTTRYYDLLKNKPNRSEYIDDALRFYSNTVNWGARGIDEEDVEAERVIAAIGIIKDFQAECGVSWEAWLRSQLRRLNDEGEGESE